MYVIPQLSLLHLFDFNRLWWAQDGAPPLRVLGKSQRFEEIFNDRIISLHR